MITDTATVYVVDDDASVLRAAARLFRSVGLHVETFESAEAFLASRRPSGPGCLILDLQMPGASGMELHQSLADHGIDLPVDVTFESLRLGVVDFLPKPVDDERLISVVQQAIDDHAERLNQDVEHRAFRERVQSLTKREHEVMLHVVTGMLNKQIARHLGITETTVKVHRGRVMEKTQVGSVAELVRMCERSGVTSASPE